MQLISSAQAGLPFLKMQRRGKDNVTEEKGEDKAVLLSCLEGWKNKVGETKPRGSECCVVIMYSIFRGAEIEQ